MPSTTTIPLQPRTVMPKNNILFSILFQPNTHGPFSITIRCSFGTGGRRILLFLLACIGQEYSRGSGTSFGIVVGPLVYWQESTMGKNA